MKRIRVPGKPRIPAIALDLICEPLNAIVRPDTLVSITVSGGSRLPGNAALNESARISGRIRLAVLIEGKFTTSRS